MLVELHVKSTKSLNVLQILVKLPVTYIDSSLKPFFWPPLKDEKKQYGSKWQDDLSTIRDPAHMFAFVSKTRIAPRRASEFVKTFFSSDSITNRTRLFTIYPSSWREVTGNISFTIQLSAFNQNHSTYQSMSHHSRTHPVWRWRRAEYRFNLTVLLKPAWEV